MHSFIKVFKEIALHLDNILPGVIGLNLLKKKAGYKVVMISIVGQEAVIQERMDLGANGYLVKPFSNEKLINIIDQTIAA